MSAIKCFRLEMGYVDWMICFQIMIVRSIELDHRLAAVERDYRYYMVLLSDILLNNWHSYWHIQ